MAGITTRVYWYALKVFYNKVFEIEAYLQQNGFESYIPLRKVEMISHGKSVMRHKPAVASLMFFRSTERDARELQTKLKNRVIVYSDRETKHPTAIPENEMSIFILVTSSGDNGLEYLSDEALNYNTGDMVYVTGGLFKGAKGYIRRIKGNRRLVVSIEGVVAVATSYIPGYLLEKYNPEYPDSTS